VGVWGNMIPHREQTVNIGESRRRIVKKTQ
jgi:hypothetical protein